jgi:hypothetical protein
LVGFRPAQYEARLAQAQSKLSKGAGELAADIKVGFARSVAAPRRAFTVCQISETRMRPNPPSNMGFWPTVAVDKQRLNVNLFVHLLF